jgi:hypothetical protein
MEQMKVAGRDGVMEQLAVFDIGEQNFIFTAFLPIAVMLYSEKFVELLEIAEFVE